MNLSNGSNAMETLDSLTDLQAEAGGRALERIREGKPFTIWLWVWGRKRHDTGLPAGEGPKVARHAMHYVDSPGEAVQALRNLAESAEALADEIEAEAPGCRRETPKAAKRLAEADDRPTY